MGAVIDVYRRSNVGSIDALTDIEIPQSARVTNRPESSERGFMLAQVDSTEQLE